MTGSAPKRKRKRRRPLIGWVLAKLRQVDSVEPDIVIGIRMRYRDDGGWNVVWNVAHWLKFDPGTEPLPNELPHGVAAELAKRFSYVAAKNAGGDFMATLGASFGKRAVEELGSVLDSIARKE
jgi:hypothetical protein